MQKFRHYLLTALASLGLFALPPLAAVAETAEKLWPRDLAVSEGQLTLYEPQYEALESERLDMRMAVAFKESADAEPVFGALWLKARVRTDNSKRLVRVIDVADSRLRFPDDVSVSEQSIASALNQQVPGWNLTLSLDGLLAAIEETRQQESLEAGLSTEAPTILYVDEPAVLIPLDGEAILEKIDNSNLMAVVNTPYPMVFRPSNKTYYLLSDAGWYESRNLTGNWRRTSNVPSDISALKPQDTGQEQQAVEVADGNRRIIVVTTPTELISSDGAPRYEPAAANDVMYVSNSDNNILFDVDTGQHYVLLSGRWYRSKELDSSWDFVKSSDLPRSFANIDPSSPASVVRASVPGTDEANDALLNTYVPTTAAVNRKSAKLDVVYDGAPQFDGISGTDMRYAKNTATPVIYVDNQYYAVDRGVWFTSGSPEGPWYVTDYVPDDVRNIPPSSPVYNVKYVYVYDSTPDVVYVGYTPGYLGSYRYYGSVVYGTGYHYNYWHDRYYYPRPFTWGFGTYYDPWYGWSFGYSSLYFSSWLGFGWSSYHRHHHYGWWGPHYYRPHHHRHYYSRYDRHRRYDRHGYRDRDHHRGDRHYRRGDRHKSNLYVRDDHRGDNLYSYRGDTNYHNQATGRSGRTHDGRYSDRYDNRSGQLSGKPGLINRSGSASTDDRRGRRSTGSAVGENGRVYTDTRGNVYRRNDDGSWQRNIGGKWRGVPNASERGRASRSATTAGGDRSPRRSAENAVRGAGDVNAPRNGSRRNGKSEGDPAVRGNQQPDGFRSSGRSDRNTFRQPNDTSTKGAANRRGQDAASTRQLNRRSLERQNGQNRESAGDSRRRQTNNQTSSNRPQDVAVTRGNTSNRSYQPPRRTESQGSQNYQPSRRSDSRATQNYQPSGSSRSATSSNGYTRRSSSNDDQSMADNRPNRSQSYGRSGGRSGYSRSDGSRQSYGSSRSRSNYGNRGGGNRSHSGRDNRR